MSENTESLETPTPQTTSIEEQNLNSNTTEPSVVESTTEPAVKRDTVELKHYRTCS